jgi:hypothetical protein
MLRTAGDSRVYGREGEPDGVGPAAGGLGIRARQQQAIKICECAWPDARDPRGVATATRATVWSYHQHHVNRRARAECGRPYSASVAYVRSPRAPDTFLSTSINHGCISVASGRRHMQVVAGNPFQHSI